jgi:light-harvesting complex 1 beta chain
MATEYERRSTLSGLSELEAREFNRIFVLSFIIFTSVAIVAHFLAYLWRPWGGDYRTSQLVIDSVMHHAHLLTALT